jgi:hypothetical protein
MDFNSLDVTQKYNELVRVLNTMEKYNRTNGWMRWDGDKMRFYDSEVEEGVFVEIGWVRFWVAAFK